MRELQAVVTRKGQVTIPAEVRKALDLRRGDVVVFTVPTSRGDSTVVRRAPAAKASVVEQTAGIFRGAQPAPSPREERAAAEQAWADEVLERLGE
jgi:AbrB family looped-hinge helix DNA binding protein